MRARVTQVVSNEDDRTVDLTVAVYTDSGALLETDNIILPVDKLSKSLANRRIKELLRRVILRRSTFPYTDAQLNTMLLNMVAVEAQ